MSRGFSGVGLHLSRVIGGISHLDVLHHTAGTVNLTEDLYANSLSVGNGVTLNTNGFRIYVRNHIRLYGTGIIRHVGAAGVNGASGGTAAAATAMGTTGGGSGGGAGNTTDGAVGVAI